MRTYLEVHHPQEVSQDSSGVKIMQADSLFQEKNSGNSWVRRGLKSTIGSFLNPKGPGRF